MNSNNETYWYVLRDQKRANAKMPAYLELQGEKYQLKDKIFIPLKQQVYTHFGKKVVKYVPYMNDLIFVHESRKKLDPIIESIKTLEYRFARGGKMNDPMKVRDSEMSHFIDAVQEIDKVEYFSPEEVSPMLYGKTIRIVGGTLNGYEGRLLSLRGSKKKRLIIDLKGFLSAAIEVNPEYIQLMRE